MPKQDKIDRKLQSAVDSIVRPKQPKRKRTKADERADHNDRLVERRISRLVRGAQRRNERKRA